MHDHERIKRPEPERTAPIRNWSALFGGVGERAGAGPGAPQGAAGGSIPQSVAMGYRLIEDYIRRGQEAARSMWPPSGPGPDQGAQGPGAQSRLMEDVGRQAVQFMTSWLEVVLAAGGAPGSVTAGPFFPPQPSPEPSPPRAEPAPATMSTSVPLVTLDIASLRRVEVSLDLRANAWTHGLRVLDLRAADPERPRISQVSLTAIPSEDRVVLRVQIADDLPADTYCGVVLDERSQLPRGTVTVRVVPPSAE